MLTPPSLYSQTWWRLTDSATHKQPRPGQVKCLKLQNGPVTSLSHFNYKGKIFLTLFNWFNPFHLTLTYGEGGWVYYDEVKIEIFFISGPFCVSKQWRGPSYISGSLVVYGGSETLLREGEESSINLFPFCGAEATPYPAPLCSRVNMDESA